MTDQCVLLKLVLTLALMTKYTSALNSITADKIYFRNENLTTVPKDPPRTDENTDGITKAVFSHNHFKKLTSDDFVQLAKYPNLKYVFFDHNQISDIDEGTFVQVPKLKFLDLSHNKLTEISDGLYADLAQLSSLQYINLKRNPVRDFKNIDKLVAKGVQIEYDGVLGREKKLRMRNRRVASSDGTAGNDFYEDDKEEDPKKFEHYIDEMDEEKNMTVVEDKPIKAYVVDHKTDHKSVFENNPRPNNFLGSIIFNFLAAFLVLVALPIAMVIYYFLHRNDGVS